jgi:copper oxidase (laccase) domain-containing protein
MTALEFPLAQGWTRGLTIGFENARGARQFNWGNALHVKQVHGNVVLNVTGFQSSASAETAAGEADGLFCEGEWLKETGQRLVIKTADCLPLFFIERVQKKICAIHAGWRGLQKKIHLWPFESGEFDPSQTWVWLGPSLDGDPFEVREDMWSQFDSRTLSDPQIFKASLRDKKDTKIFSPWSLIARDYEAVKLELLYNVEVNTYTQLEWASYRRFCHSQSQTSAPPTPALRQSQNLSWVGAAQPLV